MRQWRGYTTSKQKETASNCYSSCNLIFLVMAIYKNLNAQAHMTPVRLEPSTTFYQKNEGVFTRPSLRNTDEKRLAVIEAMY